MKRIVNKISGEGKEYYYCDFGAEYHYKKSFRLWVDNSFVSFENDGQYLYLPTKGRVVQGKKDVIL